MLFSLFFSIWLLLVSRLTNRLGWRKPRTAFCLKKTAAVTMPLAGRDARTSVRMSPAAVANRWASWGWPRLATRSRPTHAPTITLFVSLRLRCRRRRLVFSTTRADSRMWPFCPRRRCRHQLIRHTPSRRVSSTTPRPWPKSKSAAPSIRRTPTRRSNWAAPTRKTLNRFLPTMEVQYHHT